MRILVAPLPDALDSNQDAYTLHLRTLYMSTRGATKTVGLTTNEANLVGYLLLFPGQDVCRHVLLKHVWGNLAHYPSRAIDVTVSRLRKKLMAAFGVSPLLTIHSFGYRWDAKQKGEACIQRLQLPDRVLDIKDSRIRLSGNVGEISLSTTETTLVRVLVVHIGYWMAKRELVSYCPSLAPGSLPATMSRLRVKLEKNARLPRVLLSDYRKGYQLTDRVQILPTTVSSSPLV